MWSRHKHNSLSDLQLRVRGFASDLGILLKVSIFKRIPKPGLIAYFDRRGMVRLPK